MVEIDRIELTIKTPEPEIDVKAIQIDWRDIKNVLYTPRCFYSLFLKFKDVFPN